MSESIAARVPESTARWLEEVAEQEDTTISKLVAAILKQHSRDVNDDEPDSTEMRFNQMEERIAQLEQDIHLVTKHAERMEFHVYKTADLSRAIELADGAIDYPRLPGNDERNEYPEEKPNISPDQLEDFI